MKAMCLAPASSTAVLLETDIPRPTPQDAEILVRVVAAGVTPTEVLWYPTSHTKNGEPRTNAVPSHEFCGEVAEVGKSVVGFEVGQLVYGMNDWFAEGALAEYCTTRPEWISAKPKHCDAATAASVPIGALTAWQGLFEKAKLESGERVLIHGGAGAVGIFAIQLAHSRGAQVTTTVSAQNAEFVKELGASEVIDYKTVPFEDVVRDFDVVFDTVGGDTLQRSWSVLKPGGRLVTIAAGSEATTDARRKAAFFIVEPSSGQLTEIAMRMDTGELRPVVDRVVPFSQAGQAFSGTLQKQGRGKVVVLVNESTRET